MNWKTDIQRRESKIHPLGPNQKIVQETDEYACLLNRIWWNLEDLVNRIWCSILVLSAAARIRLWSVGGIAAMYPCSLARPHPAPRFRWRRLWGQVRSFEVKSISKYKWIFIEVSLLVLYVRRPATRNKILLREAWILNLGALLYFCLLLPRSEHLKEHYLSEERH